MEIKNLYCGNRRCRHDKTPIGRNVNSMESARVRIASLDDPSRAH